MNNLPAQWWLAAVLVVAALVALGLRRAGRRDQRAYDKAIVSGGHKPPRPGGLSPALAGIGAAVALTLGALTINAVKIRAVRPSTPVAAAIDAKIKAQQEAEQAKIVQGQKVTEAETARQVAEKAAEAARIAAQGEADATRTKAQAEADANTKVGQSVTPELVDYVRAQALKDANTIYVPSDGTVVVAPQGTATK